MKKILGTVLVVAIGGILAGVFFNNRPTPKKNPPQIATRPASLAPSLVTATNLPALKPVASENVAVVPEKIDRLPKPQKQNFGKVTSAKNPAQDPDARAALSLVGANPEAEAYWVSAINDPNLPANERKDLIEDLNEDGLSDPKHPGAEDLPLIVNRLRLIDELAPYALDQVNADAFQEAQKDLLAMLDGKPVQ